MKKMLLFCCGLVCTAALQARIIHVPAAYPTIQQGINAASPGDTVLVDEGSYFEQIDFLGKKPLLVASLFVMDGDANHIDNTILDGSQLTDLDHASVVYFISGEDTTSILSGFTIQKGKGTVYADQSTTYRAGGGIFISSSGAKIIHNHITDNHLSNVFSGDAQTVCGAGIGSEWVSGAHWVVVSNNIIDQNSCTSNDVGAGGAGINMYYNTRITGNTISGNTCTGQGSAYAIGAGFSCGMDGTALYDETAIVNDNLISNNIVTAVNNLAHSSAGLVQLARGVITNNTIENNTTSTNPTYGGGCAIVFWIPKEGCVVRNNTFMENISNNLSGGLGVQTPETDPNPKTLLVENNYFFNNRGKAGAAVWADVNPVILKNNVFSGNKATQYGGAIYCMNSQPVSTDHKIILINNSFFGNKAFRGGALYTGIYRVKPLIINSIFWGDTATTANEIYLTYSADTVEIASSNINTDYIFGRFHNGGGNINTDPLFTDPESLNTYIQSPVIDAGTASYTCTGGVVYNCPQYDILGMSRPWGLGYDMGAYELDFTGTHADKAFNPAIYPNPFTNSVTINFTNHEAGPVLMQVFDSYGRLVAEPVNAKQPQGEQKIEWKAGSQPAGIYYYRLQTSDRLMSGKIIKIQ
jgi:hypothetical protein